MVSKNNGDLGTKFRVLLYTIPSHVQLQRLITDQSIGLHSRAPLATVSRQGAGPLQGTGPGQQSSCDFLREPSGVAERPGWAKITPNRIPNRDPPKKRKFKLLLVTIISLEL